MELSNYGLNFIKSYEGLRLTRYLDSGGFPTIGYGHLIQPGENYQTITQDQAEQILSNDVQGSVNAVNSLVRVPLSQAMFDALVSLVFNWGEGNFSQSSHLKLLNSGDYQAAAERLGEFPVTSGGQFVQGLQNRRLAEKQLFLSQGLPGPGTVTDQVPMKPVAENLPPSPAKKKVKQPKQRA